MNFTYSTNSARLLEHLEYGVFRELDADEFIRRGNDVDAVIDLLAKAASGPRNNASDWVEIMAADLRRDPKLQISDAAARHDISPEHASRAFRRRYGITPSRFRAEEQLQHAIRLLCDKSMTLAEIAQIVGYCDQAHFTRQLVSAIGIAPSALREFIA
ncbi:MAG TPA: AraC family transcriptional regulator [Woeseiaceae bacterium]|nr:AraC family transcriptional regulator [Woeseiaceae bacterium]